MHVLAALDFSPATPRLMQAVHQWTTRLSGKLWLLHVEAPEPDFVGFEPGPATVRRTVARKAYAAHDALSREALALRESGLEVTPLLIQGPTVDSIVRESAKLRIDLIIMGSHGHGAMHDLLIGSVSRGVIQVAPCPVLIIPTRDGAAGDGTPSA